MPGPSGKLQVRGDTQVGGGEKIFPSPPPEEKGFFKLLFSLLLDLAAVLRHVPGSHLAVHQSQSGWISRDSVASGIHRAQPLCCLSSLRHVTESLPIPQLYSSGNFFPPLCFYSLTLQQTRKRAKVLWQPPASLDWTASAVEAAALSSGSHFC